MPGLERINVINAKKDESKTWDKTNPLIFKTVYWFIVVFFVESASGFYSSGDK